MHKSERPAAEEFAQFATRELAGLLRFAVMLTGDRELAGDLVQDVMLKAHTHWDRVSAAEYPGRYVRAMVTNAYLSWRRRWSVRHIFISPTGDFDQVPVDDHSAATVDQDDVWNRLATLPRQQRVVLVLRYYEHLTDDEIAAVLGCTPGTVRGYASRALATLRLQLAIELSPSKES